jgi:D-alanine-D-alanine ligase
MAARHKIRVGVLFGGRSGEHEVSLMSARSVLGAIDPEKYQITQIGITHDGAWLVGENALAALSQGASDTLIPATIFPDPGRPHLYIFRSEDHKELVERFSQLDVIFPVLHGTFGEDGTLQGLLELAEIAYVGAGVLGSALAMDKGVCKDVLRAHDIPVVESLIVTRSEIEADVAMAAERVQRLADFPLFIKPANLGSSVGVTKCNSRSDLWEGLFEAARFDRRVLVERGVVNAREIEISVLGNEEPRVSVPGEVIPSREYYSYEAKYIDDRSELIIPAPISAELTRRVQDLALRAYKAIDCAGMARVDFLLEGGAAEGGKTGGQTGELYLSELNTIPGFTKISMYPKLWEASGLPYPALIDRLIELALRRKQERDRTERRYRREA